MRAILPTIATLAILCAACSDTATNPSSDSREALASVVGGVSYPLVNITPAVAGLKLNDSAVVQAQLTDVQGSWTGKFITWKSSDPSVLKVTTSGWGSQGGAVAHIVAMKNGTATLTASTQSKTSASKSIAIGTSATTATGDTVVTRVSVTPNPLNIAAGKTYQLVGTAYNTKGAAISSAKLNWRSTNAAVLTVSASGLVTGVAKGTANVEASAINGKMAWSTITDTGGVATAPGPVLGTGKGVAAVWSDKFVSSAGVAAHFSYYDLLPYGNNRTATINAIKNAGFRFVRDGLSVDVNQGSNNLYWGIMKTITQQGMKLVLVTQPVYLGNNTWVKAPYSNQSNIDTAIARVGASNILAFEGPNEVDNNNANWGGIPAFGSNAKAYQAAMYSHVKQVAPTINVIGLTTTSAYGSSFIGDISSYMDAGTLHPYPGGLVPTAALSSMESALGVLNGAHKGWWVTETGYHTAPNATQFLFQPGVSDAAQGKYVPRLYLDYFNAGISHTSVYEIVDERNDGTSAEMNYGLMNNDGSPKPAYTAMKNMLTLLADPGASFTPTNLGYTLTGATSTVRQSLFQKRDGRFYLVLWNDVSVYNTGAKADIASSAVQVAVTLAVKPRSITRYQPYTGALGTPVTPSTSVAVSVLDNPVILEITP